MINRQVSSCGVALLLVLGGLILPAPVSAQNQYKPCTLVAVSETEALVGEKVVKSIESEGEGENSLCQRWLAGGRTFLLTVGGPVATVWEGKTLSNQAQEKIRKMGGKWESRQFGATTCTTVIAPSKPGLGTTTCVAEVDPLFLGDGFDNTTGASPLFVAIQITAGRNGIVPMDRVHALVEKALARMP